MRVSSAAACLLLAAQCHALTCHSGYEYLGADCTETGAVEDRVCNETLTPDPVCIAQTMPSDADNDCTVVAYSCGVDSVCDTAHYDCCEGDLCNTLEIVDQNWTYCWSGVQYDNCWGYSGSSPPVQLRCAADATCFTNINTIGCGVLTYSCSDDSVCGRAGYRCCDGQLCNERTTFEEFGDSGARAGTTFAALVASAALVAGAFVA